MKLSDVDEFTRSNNFNASKTFRPRRSSSVTKQTCKLINVTLVLCKMLTRVHSIMQCCNMCRIHCVYVCSACACACECVRGMCVCVSRGLLNDF